jgi:hypothetical protein
MEEVPNRGGFRGGARGGRGGPGRGGPPRGRGGFGDGMRGRYAILKSVLFLVFFKYSLVAGHVPWNTEVYAMLRKTGM